MNYATLVSKTRRSDVSEVTFITTNYDLFLEQALSREYNHPFNNIIDYMPNDKKWIYAKLHGSINWGRKIGQNKIKNPGEGLPALLDNVENINLETDLENDIVIDNSYERRPDFTEKIYPVMTVPVDNKYQFSCPDDHVQKVRTFLQDCKNFLIIGVSGKDRDLLDLLSQNCKSVSLVVIAGGKKVKEAQQNFKDAVPQFREAGWRADYDDGFSSFIISNGLDAFLNDATP